MGSSNIEEEAFAPEPVATKSPRMPAFLQLQEFGRSMKQVPFQTVLISAIRDPEEVC